MSYVVAVAGPIGSGKTSLVQGLVGQLGDACAIHMDHYERMTRQPVGEISRWADRGADFDQLEVPLLAEHLRGMKERAASKYIVFETQFGRAHRATGALIDLLIWIDIPLEMALARKLKAFSGEALRDEAEAARERLEWLDGYLANYLGLVRRLLVVQASRVRPQAEVIVDGTGELGALVRLAGQQVLQRLP